MEYLTGFHARAFHVNPAPLSRNAVRLMQKYDWPGNIRQLDNLIRSYVLMGSEEALVAELVEEEKPASRAMADVDVSQPISLKLVTRKATHELERQIILKVLKANNWNRQKTAKWLKISYRSLLYKLNDVGAANALELNGGVGRGQRRRIGPVYGKRTNQPDSITRLDVQTYCAPRRRRMVLIVSNMMSRSRPKRHVLDVVEVVFELLLGLRQGSAI